MVCCGHDHGEDVIESWIILELNGIEYPIPKSSFLLTVHRFASGLCLCVWYIQAPDKASHPRQPPEADFSECRLDKFICVYFSNAQICSQPLVDRAIFFSWVYCICGNTTPKQTWNWLCLPSIIGVSTSYTIIQLYIQLQLSFWCCCDCWRSRIRFTRKYAWCMASCLDEPWSNLNVLVGTNSHCTRG